MGKKEYIPWSVRLEPDLYVWIHDVTRKVPGKIYVGSAQHIANEALRDYRRKLERTGVRRSDEEILAAKDDVIAEHNKRFKNRTRKPT